MKTLKYSAVIDAAPRKVWQTMIAQDSYMDWTSVFAAGSYFEGSWEKGSRIRFLIPDGSGMVSEIADSRPFEFICLRHLGVIKDGVEDTQAAAAEGWANALETYTFKATGSGTEVSVSLDCTPQMESFMEQIWPRALARLKELCEAS